MGINLRLIKFFKCATPGGRLVPLCSRAGSAVSNAQYEFSYSKPSIALSMHIVFY
jgi:hypothetical protein